MESSDDFSSESAAIKKRFFEKLESEHWQPFQVEGEGPDKIEILTHDFSDAPTTAFMSKFRLENQAANPGKILHLLLDYDKRLVWDVGALSPDSKCLKQVTPTRSIDLSVSMPVCVD